MPQKSFWCADLACKKLIIIYVENICAALYFCRNHWKIEKSVEKSGFSDEYKVKKNSIYLKLQSVTFSVQNVQNLYNKQVTKIHFYLCHRLSHLIWHTLFQMLSNNAQTSWCDVWGGGATPSSISAIRESSLLVSSPSAGAFGDCHTHTHTHNSWVIRMKQLSTVIL